MAWCRSEPSGGRMNLDPTAAQLQSAALAGFIHARKDRPKGFAPSPKKR
jgi:hypothetical protein